MSELPVAYLHSLAHALASMQLYGEGHPARARVVDRSFGRLQALFLIEEQPNFSFIEGAVIYGNFPIHDLRDWTWANRLPRLGVQRVEFDKEVTRDSYGGFLDDVVARLVSETTTDQPPPDRPGIRLGSMRVIGAEDDGDESGSAAVATLPYRLGEEADAVHWLYERAAKHKQIPFTEVEAVVRSLAVAMHADGRLVVPLLEMNVDQYSALHAINVSVLAMTMAESLGMASRDVRAFGTAGLLHDIGMTQVPEEVLAKEHLTPEDWQHVRRHPIQGAKLLLQKSDEHEIAAVAAYEHHSRPDGTGYPHLRFPRDHHYVSKVIAVCDAYDAMRAPKRYRSAWGPHEALLHIEQGAGALYDAGVAATFVAMIRRIGDRLLIMPAPETLALPPSEIPAEPPPESSQDESVDSEPESLPESIPANGEA